MLLGAGGGTLTKDGIMEAIKKKAIKDIFGLEVDIEGVDDAPGEEKYIYIEDKHALGDLDLLENEAGKDENTQTVAFFVVLFMIASMSAIVCSYLNYTFDPDLATRVFGIFAAALLCELLIVRPLLILALSIWKYCQARRKGYTYIEFKSSKAVQKLLRDAVKNMFHHHDRHGTRGGPTPGGGKDTMTTKGKKLKDFDDDKGSMSAEELDPDEEAQEVAEEEEKEDQDGAAHT